MPPSQPPIPTKTKHTTRAERRAYPRHKPAERTTCLVWTNVDPTPVAALVQDLSSRGLSLIVRDWYEMAEVVCVQLFNGSMTFCLRAHLRVTRRCTLPEGDYFVAGELDSILAPSDLLPFLVG